MYSQRQIEYVDVFSFDIQDEPGRRTMAADGTPLEEPEEITLKVLVLWTPHPLTSQPCETRIRYMPESWEQMREKVNGGVVLPSSVVLP